MKVKRSDLKSKAKLNVNVTKKSSGNEEVLKKGNVVDIANKNVPHGTSIVGMSKGITKNMDNYESLRIDVWIAVPTEEIAMECFSIALQLAEGSLSGPLHYTCPSSLLLNESFTI